MSAEQIVKGKVLGVGVRRGVTVTNRPYAYAWCSILDGQLREVVELTDDISDGRSDPFANYARGQFVEHAVGVLRVFHGALTYPIAYPAATDGPGLDALADV